MKLIRSDVLSLYDVGTPRHLHYSSRRTARCVECF